MSLKLQPWLPVVGWVRGDKISADKAAVDAMRLVLNSMSIDGRIIIGEGEKDQAPMLFNGEVLGQGTPPQVDIAVDPIDGTRPDGNRWPWRARGRRDGRARQHVLAR